MRTKILAALALAVALPAQVLAATDYYLKLDGVEGESTTSAPAPTTTRLAPVADADDSRPPTATDDTANAGTVAAPPTPPQEASVDAFIKIDGVEGETEKKGNVEMQWKVEEGTKAAEGSAALDVASGAQPLTPDFSILLGGGSDDDDAQASRDRVADILLKGAQEEGAPVEQVSLNFEKIKAKVRQSVKLFGFVPMTASAEVEIDAEKRVSVRFPWWALLASGKDSEGLGQRTLETLLSVLQKNQALVDGLLIIRY